MAMATHECQATVEVGGVALDALDTWSIIEDVDAGSRLELVFGFDEAPEVVVGDRVDVTVDLDEPQAFRFWLDEETRVWSRDGQSFMSCRASDPFGHCRGARQFRSHPGGGTFASLVRNVLRQQGRRQQASFAARGPDPRIARTWLLQADEPGDAFLRRVAAAGGHVPYWDRDAVRCERMGAKPATTPRVNLEDIDVSAVQVTGGHELPGGHLHWTDEQGFEPHVTRCPGDGRLCVRCEDGRAPEGRGRFLTWDGRGSSLVAEGALLAVRLGAELSGIDFAPAVVHSIEHRFVGAGGYTTRVRAVPPADWGVPSIRTRSHLLGPFPARVTHNQDPERLGRVRVALVDDPEARPSPWVPVTTVQGGAATGTYWVPEVGELTAVVAPSAAPERLLCLGAVRGKGERAANDWCADGNPNKVLMGRNGTGILIDDQAGTIILRTRRAEVVVGPEDIVVHAHRYTNETTNETVIETRGTVRIDGDQKIMVG